MYSRHIVASPLRFWRKSRFLMAMAQILFVSVACTSVPNANNGSMAFGANSPLQHVPLVSSMRGHPSYESVLDESAKPPTFAENSILSGSCMPDSQLAAFPELDGSSFRKLMSFGVALARDAAELDFYTGRHEVQETRARAQQRESESRMSQLTPAQRQAALEFERRQAVINARAGSRFASVNATPEQIATILQQNSAILQQRRLRLAESSVAYHTELNRMAERTYIWATQSTGDRDRYVKLRAFALRHEALFLACRSRLWNRQTASLWTEFDRKTVQLVRDTVASDPVPVMAAIRGASNEANQRENLKGAVGSYVFVEIAMQVPGVGRAVEAQRVVIEDASKARADRSLLARGLVADGSDKRPFSERAKTNAAPSESDVLSLVTSISIAKTRQNTGLNFRRESTNTYTTDGVSTTLRLVGLACSPAGSRQRCRFSAIMQLDERILYVANRQRDLQANKCDATFYWGANGLQSDDLAKQIFGWAEFSNSQSARSKGDGNSTSSGALQDAFVERERENRQSYEDRTQGQGGRASPYEPGKRY